MRRIWGMITLFGFLCASVAALNGRAAAADDDGFISLFNGKDLTGWQTFVGDGDAAKTFTVKKGMIVVSGQPFGYFYTDKSFKDYVLKFDWRYQRPADLTNDEKFKGNSGLLVHIQPPNKVWPKCVEVQGMNLQHGRLLGVSGAKVSANKFKPQALKEARKPVGEWNTTEVTIKNGTIDVKVNGTEVASGKMELPEGPLGFQSEGAELHFKNIKIKPLN
jgi:3-keto-disaccharide hydrolase